MVSDSEIQKIIQKRIERISQMHQNHQLAAIGQEVLAEVVHIRHELNALRLALEQAGRISSKND